MAARFRSYIPPLLAGFLVAAAFPPFGLKPLALLGLLLLVHSLRPGPTFASGFLYGIGLLAPQLHWLYTFHPLAPWGAVLLSAVPYGLAARVSRSPLTFAAAFTAAEFARSVGTFALPWGSLGALAFQTSFARLAPFLGVFGLSFLLLFAAAALLLRPRLYAPTLLFAWLLLAVAPLSTPTGRMLTVGLVQAGILPERDYEFAPRSVTEHLFRSTIDLSRRGAKIVVWSETVILEYLNRRCAIRDRIQALADSCRVTIVCGAPAIVTERDKRNAVFVFSPRPVSDSPLAATPIDPPRYDKIHLVPFGEFLPGYGPDSSHRFLPEGVGDFSPAILPRPIGRLGLLVCYEGAFPYLSASLVRGGAEILINVSNDAWSRSAAQAEQHHELAAIRAAEFRRPFLRVGNAGPSAIIDDSGQTIAYLAAGEAGAALGRVALTSTPSPSTTLGAWVAWACLLGLPFSLTSIGLLGEVKR